MKLSDTNGNPSEPEVGSKMKVWVGQMSTRRAVEGEVVRATATRVIVRYQPALRSDRVIEEAFHKKNGSRVGEIDHVYGPIVILP